MGPPHTARERLGPNLSLVFYWCCLFHGRRFGDIHESLCLSAGPTRATFQSQLFRVTFQGLIGPCCDFLVIPHPLPLHFGWGTIFRLVASRSVQICVNLAR